MPGLPFLCFAPGMIFAIVCGWVCSFCNTLAVNFRLIEDVFVSLRTEEYGSFCRLLLPICPVYENLASLPSVNVRLIFVLSGVACILIVAGAYGLVLVHFRIAELELAISVQCVHLSGGFFHFTSFMLHQIHSRTWKLRSRTQGFDYLFS
jgi:hypothetical protein